MDVHVPGADVARPPGHLGPNHPDAEADEQEGHDQCEQEQEQRLFSGLQDLGSVQLNHGAPSDFRRFAV